MSAARRYRAIPVGYVDHETLLLAMADPANVLAVDDIQMMTGLHCQVAVAAEDDIDALIGRMNTLETAVSEAVSEEEDELEGEAEVTELHESADDAPVIKLVYSVLAQAVGEGASDIHFEPDEGEMRVRFRVDGVLHETARVPKRMISGVVSRVKLMAEMDIAEKRIPQDGTGERQRRRAQDRPARDDAADPARRGLHDPHPRQGAGDAHASTSSAWRASRGAGSRPRSPGPTAPSSSPGRPAPASRRRSTPRCWS